MATNKSFLKLRHAELYYKFSKKALASTPLQSAKLYVRASDFILFDHVDVCDPEAMVFLILFRHLFRLVSQLVFNVTKKI